MAKKQNNGLRKMLDTAKKKKESMAFAKKNRQTQGPYTEEARDWALNNAGVQRQRELERRITNPVTRKKLEKERPMTTLNKWNGPMHSSENEALLNANSMAQYNQNVNLTTARNTLRRRNKK